MKKKRNRKKNNKSIQSEEKKTREESSKDKTSESGGGAGVQRDVPLKKSAKAFAITRLKWIILHGMWNPSGSQKAKR